MATYVDRLWFQITEFLPNIFAALIVLLVGWIIAEIIAAVARQGLIWLGADRLMMQEVRESAPSSSAPTNPYLLPSSIVASLVKWLIIIGAAGVAAETLNLAGVSAFIGTLLAYVPNIIVAVVILIIGLITARRLSEFVRAGGGALALPDQTRTMLSQVARYAILIFTVMAALTQLNVVPRLIEIAFAGLVFALALSFGLGGREHASEWIGRLKNRTPQSGRQ